MRQMDYVALAVLLVIITVFSILLIPRNGMLPLVLNTTSLTVTLTPIPSVNTATTAATSTTGAVPITASSTTTTNATVTTVTAQVQGSSASINKLPQLPPINNTYVEGFINAINTIRVQEGAPPLKPCPILFNFSEMRLSFLEKDHNLEITHYGFFHNVSTFLNETHAVMTIDEEILFVNSTVNPQSYVNQLEQYAPVHYQGLISSSVSYYGYAFNYTPAPMFITIPGLGLPCPTELIMPDVNMSMYCPVIWRKAPVLVIELASECPNETET